MGMIYSSGLLLVLLEFMSLVTAIYKGDFWLFFFDYTIDCPLGYFMPFGLHSLAILTSPHLIVLEEQSQVDAKSL